MFLPVKHRLRKCYGLNCLLQDVEAMTPRTCEHDLIWKQGLRRWSSKDEAIRVCPTPVWLCPHKKGHFGHRDRSVHWKNTTQTWRQTLGWYIYKPRNTEVPQQTIGSFLTARTMNQPNWYTGFGCLASRTTRQYISMVYASTLWCFVTAALAD